VPTSAEDNLLRKTEEPPQECLRLWNKNVPCDENDDNDVVVAAAAPQAASPRTSPRFGHASHVRPVAHIRRPLRRSEHKCSIQVKCLSLPP
jgi:hypothetical protein